MDVPILETPRLILRGWHATDLDGLAEMMADPATRFVGGPLSRNDTWRVMATLIGHWILRGFGFWVVERKSDGAFLGRVGLWQPEGWPGIEVGWGLDRRYWGQGYATEAAAVCFDHGFATLSVPRLLSLIDPANESSQRVAERLGSIKGMATTLLIRGQTETVDIWEMSRERWAAVRAESMAR
jgi:RimJ/RimL family protein N-acetyltransferase